MGHQRQASRQADTHFAFGKNWASYAALIGDREIAEAKNGMLKLVPGDEFRNHSFLDIGCGSGLHALAAAKLNVSSITAIDIDADSVATAKALLERHAPPMPWRVEQASILDVEADRFGSFDIVYSWGVLHHTGDMWAAIEKAAALVKPGGLFVFALYHATRMDAFWKREKRWYAHASPSAQAVARLVYRSLYRLNHVAKGVSHSEYVKNYRSARGMDFDHDIHDWLGGHPYETALAPDVERKMATLGFKPERVFASPMTRGLLGSGCDEYVYRRQA